MPLSRFASTRWPTTASSRSLSHRQHARPERERRARARSRRVAATYGALRRAALLAARAAGPPASWIDSTGSRRFAPPTSTRRGRLPPTRRQLEPLGSSDGSPNQQFVLARPPVIEGSLRLRVLERLGDEDIDKLSRKESTSRRRCRTFRCGMAAGCCGGRWSIPPTNAGRSRLCSRRRDRHDHLRRRPARHDSADRQRRHSRGAISARRRRKREQGRPPGRRINLVTALSGVNAVVAPDGAAGGSDPQDAAENVRFAPAQPARCATARSRSPTSRCSRCSSRATSRRCARCRRGPACGWWS